MKLIDLIKIADQGYRKEFPESSLLDFVNESGQPKNESGDTLALFVVQELSETYDEAANDQEQRGEAIRVIERARDNLDNTLAALEAPSKELT